MLKWTRSRTIGLLFTAAVSVYADQAFRVKAATTATPATPSKSPDNNAVKLVDEEDPFQNPVSVPATKPSEGQSVTATDVSVSDSGTVEIHVNDANLIEVLRMLSLQSQKNILPSSQVNGHVTANLYGVTVREALDAILHANGYAYREKGNFIYVYTAKEIADMEKSERRVTTQVFRLFYTPAANVVTMIKPVMSSEGQVSSTTPATGGLPSGVSDTGGDSHATEDILVVTDYPENLEKIGKVIAELDRRPQQILVEATILQATLSEDNALGVDFNVVGGVDFSQFLHSAGQITGAQLPTGDNATVGSTVHSVGTGNTFSSTVPNGFKVGVVSNNISVFLSALESVTDTVVLANPKVLALNKQKGEVIVGNEDGYVTTTVTENAQTQTVEFLKTGTRLVFRPYIGDDGYIRMEIHPEDSSGGVTLQGSQSLPHKTTTEVTSNILVKDNHTIVIGGLFRESTNTTRSQVPIAGNLPLVGPAFRQQRDQTTRQEVIILLTPHIVKDDNQYAKLSEDQLRDAEKLRVGVRKGMMPWGRERMAESCFETAAAEMAKEHPDRCKALWFLDCATNLNPKYTEAIHMKEDITGKQIVAADNSIVRRFVTAQILAEKASSTPSEKLPRMVPITAATQPVSEGLKAPASQPAAVAIAAEAPAAIAPAIAPEAPAAPTSQPAVVETKSESTTGDENADPTTVTDTTTSADTDEIEE